MILSQCVTSSRIGAEKAQIFGFTKTCNSSKIFISAIDWFASEFVHDQYFWTEKEFWIEKVSTLTLY